MAGLTGTPKGSPWKQRRLLRSDCPEEVREKPSASPVSPLRPARYSGKKKGAAALQHFLPRQPLHRAEPAHRSEFPRLPGAEAETFLASWKLPGPSRSSAIAFPARDHCSEAGAGRNGGLGLLSACRSSAESPRPAFLPSLRLRHRKRRGIQGSVRSWAIKWSRPVEPRPVGDPSPEARGSLSKVLKALDGLPRSKL